MATRILLADDDAGLRRVLQFKLQQNGYEVSSAGDGSDALKQIRSANFDLLITDMKMPGLDGIELLTQARALKPNLEVILMTAFAEVSLAVQAMKLGAFDYLQKPFEDDQLFVAIDKALKFKRLETENRNLRQQLQAKSGPGAIAGVSRQYHEMLNLIEKAISSYMLCKIIKRRQ